MRCLTTFSTAAPLVASSSPRCSGVVAPPPSALPPRPHASTAQLSSSPIMSTIAPSSSQLRSHRGSRGVSTRAAKLTYGASGRRRLHVRTGSASSDTFYTGQSDSPAAPQASCIRSSRKRQWSSLRRTWKKCWTR
eukprot:1142048-Pelagomonas_calceolata.AAC.5